MEQTLPLLFNVVDWIFFVFAIVILSVFGFIGADKDECGVAILGLIIVGCITILYLVAMRNKESTIYVPWCILVCEIVLGFFYAINADIGVEHPILGAIVALLIPFVLYYCITIADNNEKTANKNIEASSYVTEVEASEPSANLEEKNEIIPIFAFSTGANNISLDENASCTGYNFVGSGYIDGERVYIYYYENEQGELVQDYVTADKQYSSISRTLEENKQPYLKKIHKYDVTVEESEGPEEQRSEVYVETQYVFYVPEDFMVSEFILK